MWKPDILFARQRVVVLCFAGHSASRSVAQEQWRHRRLVFWVLQARRLRSANLFPAATRPECFAGCVVGTSQMMSLSGLSQVLEPVLAPVLAPVPIKVLAQVFR